MTVIYGVKPLLPFPEGFPVGLDVASVALAPPAALELFPIRLKVQSWNIAMDVLGEGTTRSLANFDGSEPASWPTDASLERCGFDCDCA